MFSILLLLTVGSLAGLLAGLLGVGGGIVIVPALIGFFEGGDLIPGDRSMHFALATSLATICFTSLSSMYAHQRRGAILWSEVLKLAPGVFLGTFLGAQIAEQLSSNTLTFVFALFLLSVSLQMGFGMQPTAERKPFGRFVTATVGTFIGLISALVGIGGGTLTVPFLVWCNTPVRVAVATSAAIGFFIALAGTLGYGISPYGLGPDYSTGYVYWPAVLSIVPTSLLFAPWGARIAHTIPVTALKGLFCFLLALMGVKLALKSFSLDSFL